MDSLFNQIGVPTSLKSAIVASLQDDLSFETIKGLLFENQNG